MVEASVDGRQPRSPAQQGVPTMGGGRWWARQGNPPAGHGLVAVGLGRGDDAGGDGRALAAAVADSEREIGDLVIDFILVYRRSPECAPGAMPDC